MTAFRNLFLSLLLMYGLAVQAAGLSVDASRALIKRIVLAHVSGTGGGPKYGNISVMPFSGDLESISQTSLRTREIAKAGYYSVDLKKWNIRTEITVSPKVAFYRFVYGNKSKCLKIDLGQFLGEKPIPDYREAQQFVGSEIKIESDREISGYSRIRGGWNNGDAYTVYFYAVADRPFSRFTTCCSRGISDSRY